MKTLKIIGLVVLIFLAFMAYRAFKNNQIRKLAKDKTELEVEFNNLQKQKETADFKLKSLKAEFSVLSTQKSIIESELTKYKAETNKLINGFKTTISEYKKLQPDEVYQNLFAMYPTFNQVLKFRFAENQIREFNIDILERGHFEGLYVKSTKSLVTCTDLNKQNDLIIGNLSGQNTNLQKQVDLSELQVVNLQDEIKLTDKTLNKQKRKTFFYKLTTIAAGTGLLIFAIK